MTSERWLSVSEARRYLARGGVYVHPNTVRRWIVVGMVPHVARVGGRLIPESALARIVACPCCASRLQRGYRI